MQIEGKSNSFRKLCASQCVIAKADKGETLIALTEADYDAKIRDFLSPSKAVPATFSYDYYNTKVRKAIRDSKTIFQTSEMLDLSSGNHVSKESIRDFECLITLCLNKNICLYRGTIYKFPDGLPIGAPLSSLAADVFMDHFERNVFQNKL